MNLLFVHKNFPGQFGALAEYLSKRQGNRIVFLTQAESASDSDIPGVKVVRYRVKSSSSQDVNPYLKDMHMALSNARAVSKALDQMRESGFVPDVVVSHCGFGFGLFVKAVLPAVRLITFTEWWFRPETALALMQRVSVDAQLCLDGRNLPQLQEMLKSDVIICPTEWQKQQFPEFIRSRIQVQFEGVNCSIFRPQKVAEPFVVSGQDTDQPLLFNQDQLLLTYGTRGMEPLRGFPEFMRAAAVAQQHFPQLQVVVFGRDRCAYSYRSHHASGSWKDAMLDELENELDLSRLHFPGLISYQQLSQLLCRSDLHCFFTRPYVVSWGVFNAAACGARLLVNAFEGMDEVFDEPPERVVDLEDQVAINQAVLEALQERVDSSGDVRPRRSRLRQGLNLRTCLRAWEQVIDPGHLRRA